MRRVVVYWRINDMKIIDKIRKRFGMPRGITVNGISTPADIKDEDWDLFKETENRGFFTIRSCETINNNQNG